MGFKKRYNRFGFILEVLCVVVWLEHSARSHAEYVNAARASEQLNVEAREANELTQSRGVEWNEADRRGRTFLLLVYRLGRCRRVVGQFFILITRRSM